MLQQTQTSAAVDQVAIWELLGESPPYADFSLDSSITGPATTLAAAASGMNTALPGDLLAWTSPKGAASVNPGDAESFLVQLILKSPNVQIDFSATLSPPGGSPTPLPSADVSPSMAFTDSEGMAQVNVTVPSNAPVGSALTVTAYTQSIWPTEFLYLLNYNSGAQNLLGVGPALNLTTSSNASVSKSLTVQAPVTITSNEANAGTVSQTSGNYGENPTTIVATANTGYQFVDWVATGGVSLTSNLASTTTFITSGTGGLEAFFAPQTPIQPTSIQVPAIATQTSFTMPSSVTLTNPDSVPETASIQVSTGSTVVFTGTATLSSQQTLKVPCVFNTNLLTIGSYNFTITVTTTSLTGSTPQTETAQSGVTYLGDLNGDGKVNFGDLCIFVIEYISARQTGTYYSNIDYYHTGSIGFSAVPAFISAYILAGPSQ